MRRFDTKGLALIAILAGSTPAAAAPVAYIPCYAGGVAVIDTATDTVTTTIPTSPQLFSAAVAPGGSRVYVSDPTTTSFIDTATNTIVDTAPAGGTTLEVDPTGERLYTNLGVSVVSTATATVVDTIPQTQIYGIAAHPAGSKVYLVKVDTDQVVVFNTVTNSVVGTIPVGDQPAMAALNPSGSRLYVSNRGDDTVSVIDTNTDLVIDTITVGDGPIGVAVTPDGSALYVVNNLDGTVSAVDTATDTLAGGIYVGGSPYRP
jgi:YVTN family beta-propeller protein